MCSPRVSACFFFIFFFFDFADFLVQCRLVMQAVRSCKKEMREDGGGVKENPGGKEEGSGGGWSGGQEDGEETEVGEGKGDGGGRG